MSYNRRNFLKSAAVGALGTFVINQNVFGEHMNSGLPFFDASYDDESYWEFVKSQFSLMDGLHYFNNGSLGPSPEYVIDRTEKNRRLLDSFPSKYMWGGWSDEKEEVRKKIAEFIGADSEEIAIIHNTSEGMNLFAQSFNLVKGDEIILADHEHRTGVAPFQYYCESRGIKLVRPVLPILPETKEEFVDIYRKAITKRTKLISMVHMTNTNGMILPVKEVSDIAHEKGINVCVDAAQCIGHIRTDVKDMDCDFYVASGHKWLWGPKGTGILYAKKNKQHLLKPLMVSSNWNDLNIRMFEDYNTRNLPDVLGLGSAVDFNNIIGQEKKEMRIYQLKRYFRELVTEDKRIRIKTPGADDLSAGIQVIEIVGVDVKHAAKQLIDSYNIDCRPMTGHNLNALRISLSVFNTLEDINYLCSSLKSIS